MEIPTSSNEGARRTTSSNTKNSVCNRTLGIIIVDMKSGTINEKSRGRRSARKTSRNGGDNDDGGVDWV